MFELCFSLFHSCSKNLVSFYNHLFALELILTSSSQICTSLLDGVTYCCLLNEVTSTKAESLIKMSPGITATISIATFLFVCLSFTGPLTEVNLPIDPLTKKVKGFAFVTFMMPEHAVKAFTQLDGKTFQVGISMLYDATGQR